MLLSEALDAGHQVNLKRLSLHRYGYNGSLEDAPALVAWLKANPLIDIPADLAQEQQSETPVRPDQQPFRSILLAAYGGACAITDCKLEAVLDAAHLRDWRESNTVNDGILLRADLHRLLDAGLLKIGRDYRVQIDSLEYEGLNGRKLRLPKRRQDWPKL